MDKYICIAENLKEAEKISMYPADITPSSSLLPQINKIDSVNRQLKIKGLIWENAHKRTVLSLCLSQQ